MLKLAGNEKPSLGQRAFSGMLWASASQLIKFLTQIAGILIVSRLIGPQNVGLAGFVAPLLSLGLLFQDLGIAQSVVQRKSLDHEDVSSLFWFQIIVTFLAATILVLLAYPASLFYGEAVVVAMVHLCACILVINGLGAMPMALANRAMQFRTLAIVEAGSACIGLIASILTAVIYGNYWAILAAPLASTTISTVVFWTLTNWRPQRPNISRGVGSHIRFGSGIAVFNLSNFFARNMDNVLIGAYVGAAALGYYDRAYKLLLLPIQQVFIPLAKIMLPTLSRIQDDPARYASAFFRVQRLLLLLVMPGVAALLCFSDWIVLTALGSEWREVAPIFQCLGLAGLLQPLNSPAGWLFASQGRSKQWAKWGIFNATTTVCGFFLGLKYGPLGVALIYSLGEFIRTPILWWYVTLQGPVRLSAVVSNIASSYLAIVVGLGVVWGLKGILLSLGFLGVLAGCAASYAIYALVLSFFLTGRLTLKDIHSALLSRYAISGKKR